jgi:hypothetical protein
METGFAFLLVKEEKRKPLRNAEARRKPLCPKKSNQIEAKRQKRAISTEK